MGKFDNEIKQLKDYCNDVYSDDVRYKEIIKKKILSDDKIIYLLNNKELVDSEAENDEYFGTSILPYYLVPDIQTDVANFICFETSFDFLFRQNSIIKTQEIYFYILCHQKNIIDQKVGAARHDLLAAEIIDLFNGCNDFGTQLKLASDKPGATDNYYATRTLVFHQETTNSVNKSNGRTIGLKNGT